MSDTNFLKVQIDVDETQVEPLETALTAFGAVSLELADAGADPILEPAPGATPLWKRVRITALFEPTADETRIRLAVAAAGAGTVPAISFDVLEDEDWVAKLRDELSPLRFGKSLWVCPPGKPCPDSDATVITMEPGLAFGTGTHPTTSLCLEWLDANRPVGCTVLDFGCGSGILGIASLALGATHVTAVDIDAQALRATRDNARRNPDGERLVALPPDGIDDSQVYDVLVANILSGTLTELAPLLQRHCRAGTRLALSGILTEQAETVTDAYRAWCKMNVPLECDGWVLLTGSVA